MKSVKLIALSAFLTIGAFSSVLYTSCSKDECKDVTCQHGGTCSGGNCTCPSGTGGNSCETIFKTTFANTYKGNGTDNDGGTYTDFRMIFTNPSSTTDYTTMNVALQNALGGPVDVPILTITLSSISASGAAFTITSQTYSGRTYTGTGTISASSASLSLTETPTIGAATIYTFNNFTKI